MVGIPGKSFPVAELAAAGVRRISLATSLYRAAMTGFLEAAREVKDAGTFGFVDRVVSTGDVVKLMEGVYNYSQTEGINLIDLGTSSLNGKPNFSLLDFKLHLGATPTQKLTFQKNLTS